MSLSFGPGAVLFLITTVTGVTIFYFLKARHIERMFQLERGIPLENKHKGHLDIKLGLLFIGIGIGILTAFVLNKHEYFNDEGVLYPAFIFLFGGAGLLISFIVLRFLQKK